jgi:hypothetical protein
LLSLIGAILTLGLNFLWIPLSSSHLIYGYYGSAWATLICYGTMMILSYLIGQKYFPVQYNLFKFFGYLGLSVLLYFISKIGLTDNIILKLLFHSLLLVVFGSVVLLVEGPKFLQKIFN